MEPTEVEANIDQRGQFAHHTGLVVEAWATHTVDSTVVVESEHHKREKLVLEEKPVWFLSAICLYYERNVDL